MTYCRWCARGVRGGGGEPRRLRGARPGRGHQYVCDVFSLLHCPGNANCKFIVSATTNNKTEARPNQNISLIKLTTINVRFRFQLQPKIATTGCKRRTSTPVERSSVLLIINYFTKRKKYNLKNIEIRLFFFSLLITRMADCLVPTFAACGINRWL